MPDSNSQIIAPCGGKSSLHSHRFSTTAFGEELPHVDQAVLALIAAAMKEGLVSQSNVEFLDHLENRLWNGCGAGKHHQGNFHRWCRALPGCHPRLQMHTIKEASRKIDACATCLVSMFWTITSNFYQESRFTLVFTECTLIPKDDIDTVFFYFFYFLFLSAFIILSPVKLPTRSVSKILFTFITLFDLL